MVELKPLVLDEELLNSAIARWPDEIQECHSFTVIEPKGAVRPERDKLVAVLIGTPTPPRTASPITFEFFYTNKVHCCLFGAPPPDAGRSPGPTRSRI